MIGIKSGSIVNCNIKAWKGKDKKMMGMFTKQEGYVITWTMASVREIDIIFLGAYRTMQKSFTPQKLAWIVDGFLLLFFCCNSV